jgi:diaminopimelate decarboxylase
MGFGDVPAIDQYAKTITDVLHQSCWAIDKKPTLVVEPGVAMAADVLSLITQVLSVKTIKDKTLVTVDGSILHTKPTMHTRNQPWECIAQDDAPRPEARFSVVGSTCMEKDYLLTDVVGPLPKPGDCLAVGQAGAYSVVMAPPFIHPAPAIVAPHGENFKLLRTRQSLDDMFHNYMF